MDTLNIAICEDMPKDAAALHRMIQKSGVSCRVFTYENGEVFLAAFQSHFFHLIFLDIYLEGHPGSGHTDAVTGMDVAMKIREADDDVWLAFSTISPDQAIAGYKVKAERYLTKPLDAEEVTALLHRTAKHWESVNDEITVTVNRRLRGISVGDIIYIEAFGKRCTIHMQDETVTTYITIDELEKMLSAPNFLRCHRSYIVNMDYIDSAERDFKTTTGDMVYISRRSQWKIREVYRRYIVRMVREAGCRRYE